MAPTKSELLAGWLPSKGWSGGVGEVRDLGSFRIDDPQGEVGVEGLLLQAGDRVLHAPLTYRGAPLEGAEEHLLGTSEHGTLGTRWVYDACADPVWVRTVVATILTGAEQAEETIEVDGVTQVRQPSATVRGSGRGGARVPELTPSAPYDEGDVTVVDAGPLTLRVARMVGTEVEGDAGTLTGRWDGSAPVVLVALQHR